MEFLLQANAIPNIAGGIFEQTSLHVASVNGLKDMLIQTFMIEMEQQHFMLHLQMDIQT